MNVVIWQKYDLYVFTKKKKTMRLKVRKSTHLHTSEINLHRIRPSIMQLTSHVTSHYLRVSVMISTKWDGDIWLVWLSKSNGFVTSNQQTSYLLALLITNSVEEIRPSCDLLFTGLGWLCFLRDIVRETHVLSPPHANNYWQTPRAGLTLRPLCCVRLYIDLTPNVSGHYNFSRQLPLVGCQNNHSDFILKS